MKVLHLNAGAETGGGMVHILSLLEQLNRDEFILGVFEEGEMSKRALEMGIRVELFKQNSRYDLSILTKIVNYIQHNHIDIVHTHGPRANLYAFLLKPFTKCKWVTTIHSDPRDDFLNGGIKGSIFTKLHFLSLRKMDHFFAISNQFKEMVIGFGFDPNRISTIYNGIDFSIPDYTPITRKELGLSDHDFVIIMIARLHPVKGHIIAFKALKELIQTYDHCKLLLIGDGPIHKELKDQTIELGIDKHVLFMGHQENIHGYLLLSDVEILTSYSESFPLVILEAARAQVPVISTNVGGVQDLISDESLGRTIPIKDIHSLKDKLKEYIQLKQKGELKILGKNLYEKASSLYSVKSFSESVYQTYKKLI